MTSRQLAAPLAIAIGALTLAACGGGSPTTPGSPPSDPNAGLPGKLTFRVSPIAQGDFTFITPLGNLNPPGHVLSTDHIYFYTTNPAGGLPGITRVPFVVPGDGVVSWMLGGGIGTESKLLVRASATVQYSLDHLILTAPVSVGQKLTAGQVLGTSGLAYAVDLGVVNTSLTLGFVNPARYFDETLHCDAPLRYFEEPLRSQLYARVQRLGPDLDGKIDFDVPGRLAGNWFVNDATPIAFVYDTYHPDRVLISVGSGSPQGVFRIGDGDPRPADVSVDSGKVLYTLVPTVNGPNGDTGTPIITAHMLVQMLDSSRIKVEMFPMPLAAADFTANARTFSR